MNKIIRAIKWFSELSSYIKLSNTLNLTDMNIHQEAKLIEILKIIYGWDLVSANLKHNARAIDLVEKRQKLVIQVTSNTRLEKLKSTLKALGELPCYKDYSLCMFYLCDEIPVNINKKAKEHGIKVLCFADLLRELQHKPPLLETFIKAVCEKSVLDNFAEYLKMRERWISHDNEYIFEHNPDFKIRVGEFEPVRYSNWLGEIRAISRGYSGVSMRQGCLSFIVKQQEICKVKMIEFYDEGLIFPAPIPAFFDDRRDLYLDIYLTEDNKNFLLYPLLLRFFNDHLQKTRFDAPRVLKSKKDSYAWMPIIDFKTWESFEIFKSFLEENIEAFDLDKALNEYRLYLANTMHDERARKNCCFHYWAHDLYFQKYRYGK